MKETKEIVENILLMEASDYDLADPSEIVTSGKTIQIMRHENHEVNIISDDTEEFMEEECSENEDIVDGECISLEDMETYEPCQEIDLSDFEVTELKEGIEKKKKKRNYIDFRKDYEEM
jgi:hypothetical protein